MMPAEMKEIVAILVLAMLHLVVGPIREAPAEQPPTGRGDLPGGSGRGRRAARWEEFSASYGGERVRRLRGADGANERLVARRAGDGAPPPWSSDGRRIAYKYSGYNRDSDIMVVGLDGPKPETVFTRGDDLSYPAWRPTSKGG